MSFLAGIPRPLLIVVLILVVLGALSCTAAGFKGPPDRDDLHLPFDAEPIAASEIGATGSCTKQGVEITVTTACELTVPAQQFPPSELRLRVVAGSVSVTVFQVIRGEVHEQNDSFDGGERFEISAAGERDVRVSLVCLLSCRLEILR